nr:putative ribonuclease H-like domain-containing protein [Tanacetum cinerariifolium]
MEETDENTTNPPSNQPTPQAPHTLSTIKYLILKKGEYDIWAMKMEHYLEHTGYPIWEVIQKGNDANKKFLRSLPSSWSQVPLIMRTKPGVYTLSFDDLYNNLRVFESDVKGSTGSSSSTQNVEFLSFDNTSGTNEVNTAYGVSTYSSHNSQREGSSSFTHELVYFFFANQSSGLKLDHEDLEHLDEFDLEEMDLKWQVAMISIRLEKFYKKTRRKLHFDAKEPVGFDKKKVKCFNYHNTRHFARECRSKGNQESRKRDAGNTKHKARDNRRRPAKQDEPKAMVTIDGKGIDWIGHAEDDTEDYALMAFNSSNSGSNTEVTSCSKECENTFAKLKNSYDKQREQIAADSIEIQAYTLALKKVEVQLASEVEKEKAKLKTKLENFQNSSKGLSKLLNSQMSAKDKSGLGDIEDSHVNDKFTKVEGMHSIPPSMTGIYMPPKFNFGIDESEFTYGPKQSKNDESKPKAVSKPNIWSDAPIIKEYELDSDDECVSKSTVEQETPNCAFINNVKHVKAPKQTVKDQDTCSQNPKVDKRDWTDCDFHEKRIAKRVELNKNKNKVICQRNDRPARNNVQRINHKNKFVSKAILTKTGRILINAAKQNFSSQAASTSTVRKVNTARQMVNDIRHRNKLFKSHAPIRRPFNKTTAPKAKFTNHKVNNDGNKTVSVVGGNRETVVKASAGCNWRSKIHYWNKFCKYNSGSKSRKCDNPHQTLKGKGIVDSGCSRHMTGNKAYLVEYQDFNGGHVAFGGSKGQITDTECLVLSPDFKLPDENQALLRVPRQHNMYCFNLEHIVPYGCLACLIAKATVDEFNKWHRRLGHVHFKNLNKLIKGNLVRGLPFKIFQNDHTCVVCHKGKQHKASAARASSPNYVKIASTTVNTASTPVNTASLSRNISAAGPSYPDLLNYVNQDDSQIPSLEDIYEFPNDGIFTSASYDNEDLNSTVQIRSKVNKSSEAHTLIEPKKISQALEDESWVDAMQEELLQFKTQQGHRQEEGINYDEVFAPVTRLKSIRIFLAFDFYMGFIVYQMDVKSAFLYGKVNEEVYVSQPPGFIDPKFPKKVYKVVKALYGLHQAPRAWYATLSTLLVKSRYRRGIIDKTLFIKKDKKDIMLVQVYMDDINFSSTKKSWCDEFEVLMKNRFQMSSMGKLTFFLGLQVKQKEDGIFISQDKYVAEILKKFDFMSVKTASTIENKKPLVKDAEATNVDVTPKTLHLQAVKRIFRYLKGQPKLGLWYPRELAFNLEAYSDSDYVGENLDRKSTTGGEGADYAMNKGRLTDKIKVLNAKAEGVSAVGETLSTDALVVSTIDKVIHSVEIDIVKLMVEIESFGMSSDEFDKETGSSDGLQPKQANLSCIHEINELHLHEIHVVLSKHEADQY